MINAELSVILLVFLGIKKHIVPSVFILGCARLEYNPDVLKIMSAQTCVRLKKIPYVSAQILVFHSKFLKDGFRQIIRRYFWSTSYKKKA